MRANAAAVLYGGIGVLSALVAFLVWREFRPIGAEAPPATGRPRPAAESGLGLRDFLAAQTAAGETPPGNPFRNPRPDRPPAPLLAPRPPAPAPPPRPAPAPAPRREMIRLLYRGLYQAPDDVPRALIEDSKRRRGSFYRVGEVLFGLRVREIRMENVILQPASGADVALKLGEPYEFEERPNGY